MLTISAKGQKKDERIRVQHGASQIQMLVKRSGTNISVDSGGNDDYPASPCVAPSTAISSYICISPLQCPPKLFYRSTLWSPLLFIQVLPDVFCHIYIPRRYLSCSVLVTTPGPRCHPMFSYVRIAFFKAYLGLQVHMHHTLHRVKIAMCSAFLPCGPYPQVQNPPSPPLLTYYMAPYVEMSILAFRLRG